MTKAKFDKDAAAKKMLSGVLPSPMEKSDLAQDAPGLDMEQGGAAQIPTEEMTVLPQATEREPEQKSRAGRKPKEKRIQASIYFSENQLVALNEQSGYGKKERDKSALVRFGVDLVLAMSDEEYANLKAMATLRDCSPADIIRAALANDTQ